MSSHQNPLLLEEEKAKRQGFNLIAGIDEAGRGPLAGPVVAASVVLMRTDFTVRIDDSKLLTAAARERAYPQIVERAAVGIGIVAEDVIDDINIHNATIMAMEKAVLDMAIKPDLLLVDGNVRLRFVAPQVTIIDGDKKEPVYRMRFHNSEGDEDRLLKFYDTIFPDYGFSKHKGYGTKEHIAALGEKGFSPLHRRSFKVR